MFWEFLIQNNGVIILIFTAIVTVSTVVYAILTCKLVDETIKMRKAQTEPKISISIQPAEQSINVVEMIIQNTGYGPAYDVSFKLSKDFELIKNKYLSEMGFIKRGIGYIAPGQKIKFFLANMIENYEKKSNISFNMRVAYKDKTNKIKSHNYKIDLSEFKGMLRLGEPPLHKISKEIEKIQEDLHSIVCGFDKLNVNIYDRKDRDEKDKEDKSKLEKLEREMESLKNK